MIERERKALWRLATWVVLCVAMTACEASQATESDATPNGDGEVDGMDVNDASVIEEEQSGPAMSDADGSSGDRPVAPRDATSAASDAGNDGDVLEASDAGENVDGGIECPEKPMEFHGLPCDPASAPTCEYGLCVLDWHGELSCTEGQWHYSHRSCFPGSP